MDSDLPVLEALRSLRHHPSYTIIQKFINMVNTATSSYWLAPGISSPRAVSPDPLMDFVIEHFKLDKGFFSKAKSSRRPEHVNVKHMIRHYLYHHYQITMKQIGEITCRADHSTIVHSIRKHEQYMQVDFEYRNAYNAFQKEARALGFHERMVDYA